MKTSELGLISAMRFDGRTDIQSVKSAWSIYVQSLKHALYCLSRGKITDVKRTHNGNNTIVCS